MRVTGPVQEEASSLGSFPENTTEEILQGGDERGRVYGEDPHLPIVRVAAATRLRYKPKKEKSNAVETAAVKGRIVFDYDKMLLDKQLWDCPR